METKPIAVEQLCVGDGTQIRTVSQEEAAREYAQSMQDGAQFPPLEVVTDGIKNWLVDGFTRLAAYKLFWATKPGNVSDGFVQCNMTFGSRKDAIKAALGANSRHGVRRTNADKQNAIEIACREFPASSSREIARICGVDDKTVAAHRTEKPEKVVGANGVTQAATKTAGAEVPHLATADTQPHHVDLGGVLPGEPTPVHGEMDVTPEPEVSDDETTLLQRATEKLMDGGKDPGAALDELGTMIANLQRDLTAKCRQDYGALLSVARGINADDANISEFLPRVKALATYYRGLEAALSKLGG